MAQKEFVLQGFSQRSHVQAVQEAFAVTDIEQVLISVAYVKESGVEQIESYLRANAVNVTVFAGIRNDITSYQALRRLYEISGLTLYTFDTGTPSVTFHPKVYLVKGAERARLVIGSANLTLGGLQNNIEAGMVFDFDLTSPDDLAVTQQIITQLRSLPTAYPNNVSQTKSLDDLETLFDKGLIIDEGDVPPPRPARTVRAVTSSSSDRVPRIRLPLTPLRSRRTGPRTRPARAVTSQAAPAPPATTTPTPATTPTAPATPATPTAPSSGTPVPLPTAGTTYLVWQSKPLTERDLNIPAGANTHATGSMSLDKGLLPDSVDHRPYFRQTVFHAQNWTLNAVGTVEVTYAKFQLVLRGVNYGEFDLRISHTVSTTSASYLQRNAMTRLSWGPVAPFIGQRVLIGETLNLYRDMTDPTRFVLEIS